ncbi:hypothetical protein B0H21DRAFT_736543 [Amylocystis lapponica]|nr:hypothetical protein B0H21DRAFT_736543 [Amylocystis lapponica]
MSTRRRVGFNTSSSEASRRQLMQPVPVWEKVWTLPESAAPGSTLKVYKWVKTDKKHQFSDDEGETDQPLAPLPEPDDAEGGDGDDELDPDETLRTSVAPDNSIISRDVSEPAALKDGGSKPATPKPHPLSISFQPPTPTPGPGDTDALDDSLIPSGDLAQSVPDGLDGAMSLDMSQMGPDGEPYESAQDLSQIQGEDALLGASLLDEEMDPFAVPQP